MDESSSQSTAGQRARCTIMVRRDSVEDIQQRQVVVKMDGERIGELLFGQSIVHEVDPGPHRLVVDNTWNWKTVNFQLSPGEHAEFLARNRAGHFGWFLLFTLGAGPIYVSIERVR